MLAMATINTNISIAIATESPSPPTISTTKPNPNPNPTPPLLTSFAASASASASAPAPAPASSDHGDSNEPPLHPPFTPYAAHLPWHTGPRAFLSHFFPKYGHYCGPNWSSGRSHGPLLWNLRPIDSLDYCCFCHDIGYDTHDQARLYRADLDFLECLSRIPDSASAKKKKKKKLWNPPRHESPLAVFYRTACIIGNSFYHIFLFGFFCFVN